MNGVIAAAIGRPGRDPDFKYTPNGTALLSFSLAVEDAKKREGDDTQWLRISVWGERAEALAKQVKKGGLIYVEGRCKVRQWTASDGATRADLELSAWRCEPLFQHGRRPQDEQPGEIRPGRPMPERMAVGVGAPRNTRQALGLDDETDPEGLPF